MSNAFDLAIKEYYGLTKTYINTAGFGIGATNPLRPLHIAAAEPSILMEETDVAADNKVWRIYPSSTTLTIGPVSDNVSSGQAAYQIQRTGTAVTNHTFFTNNTARMQINSAGSMSIGTGGPGAGQTLAISKNLTGATTAYGCLVSCTALSDVTNTAYGFASNIATTNASFTLSSVTHFYATQATFNSPSVVTSQFGFSVSSNLTGATNNYGFYGNIPAGTNRWNLYLNGTADNYMAGALGIGSTTLSAGFTIRTGRNLTGSTYVRNIYAGGVVQADATSGGTSFETNLQLANGVAITGNWAHFNASQGSFGTGTLATQYGFYVANSLTGATNNYGFYGNLASGTGRWNLYMAGSALNYINGETLFGTALTGSQASGITVLEGGGRCVCLTNLSSDATAKAGFITVKHYTNAEQDLGVIAGYTTSTDNIVQYGGSVSGSSSLNAATNHRWVTAADNVTLVGTEKMRLDSSGQLLVGTTASTGQATTLQLLQASARCLSLTSATTDATIKTGYISVRHYTNAEEDAVAIGLQSTPAQNNVLYGGYSSSLNAATSHIWFTAANNTTLTGTERMRLDSSGNLLLVSTGGLGYGTGSGGSVTQTTSRTTAVTLDRTNGGITMFTAAGSTTAATFTVNNSTVAATDTIILNQRTGTNAYVLMVTRVTTGQFDITFFTTGGTASDAPVINFSVIKAVTA